jgi:hypothetical protein
MDWSSHRFLDQTHSLADHSVIYGQKPQGGGGLNVAQQSYFPFPPTLLPIAFGDPTHFLFSL